LQREQKTVCFVEEAWNAPRLTKTNKNRKNKRKLRIEREQPSMVNSKEVGCGLGVTLGATNSEESHPDNQQVKCRVCWVSPSSCHHAGAGARVNRVTFSHRSHRSHRFLNGCDIMGHSSLATIICGICKICVTLE